MLPNLSPSLTRAKGIAIGKALRKTVPRSSHEQWQPAIDRPEPIALLEASNQGNRFGAVVALPCW